jgi:hypothetical protein
VNYDFACALISDKKVGVEKGITWSDEVNGASGLLNNNCTEISGHIQNLDRNATVDRNYFAGVFTESYHA